MTIPVQFPISTDLARALDRYCALNHTDRASAIEHLLRQSLSPQLAAIASQDHLERHAGYSRAD